MSGVMLKTAIYGLLRVMFDLLHTQVWWWGVLALALGPAHRAVRRGVRAVQTDMKRLLAYSSIENIGFIMVGIGLTVTFQAYGMQRPRRARAHRDAATTASTTPASRACCSSRTGSVLHATRERALGKLGGLIDTMPWVAWLALVGTLAIAGLPPLNGFVSEWLLLQAFLFTPRLPDGYLNMLMPVAAAAVALAAALSGYVMVKFYGVIFLGQPREEKLAEAHDCRPVGARRTRLAGRRLRAARRASGAGHHRHRPWTGTAGRSARWRGRRLGPGCILAPIDPIGASYSPFAVSRHCRGGRAAGVARGAPFYHGRVRRAPAWDCGFPLPDPRACRTRPRASDSRCGRCSSRSSA